MSQAVIKKPLLSLAEQALAKTLERQARWWATAVLLLMFALALTSMAQKAPTFDEQGFIVRGLAYLRGYPQIRVGHPPGLNALNAAFLAVDEAVELPLDDPSWVGSSFHRPAERFLWEIGNNVEHIMFLARLPSIWLGILLAGLAGRWAWEITKRRWAGLMAVIFVALDPNILAHARLATTDLGLTAFALLAGYTLWRFLKCPSWRRVILAGAAFGLLQNTKFTAGLFIPLFGLVIIVALGVEWHDKRKGQDEGTRWTAAIPWRTIVMLLLAYPMTALLTLWATNGFDISRMPADLPLLPALSGRTLPLARYLEQLLDIGGRMQVGTPSFLLGEYSDSGWWYYFPVAFLLKTPVPTLLLLSGGAAAFIVCFLRYRFQGQCLSALDSSALLFPGLGFFAIALTTDINLGYRHILPVLPFFVVFAVAVVASGTKLILPRARVLVVTLLAIWLAAIAVFIYPDYLAYFNIFAGGPANGWRSLVDSNLDWGQDLDDLPNWMVENGVDEVWLSYFGEGRPAYYGISYQGLDSFPPRLMDPQARPFAPSNPAPGIYAISASNLQGVQFKNHDQFAWFRQREPLDKLGYSIFLYQVPATGEPAVLLLSGLQIDEVRAEDYALLETNDVTGRWFDLQQSLVLPNDDNVWLARRLDEVPSPRLSSYLNERLEVVATSNGYELARYEPPAVVDGKLAEFSLDDGRVLLQRTEIEASNQADLRIATRWRQLGPSRPLKIFVHATDQDGRIIAQWDGLGVNWRGWLEGDTLIQLHTLTLPDDYPQESLRLRLGVYDPETGQRWLTEDGLDQFSLQE